jgi:hypothetical protein
MSGERSAYESNLKEQIMSLSNKRHSYNGKQQEFINRLTEQILHKQVDETKEQKIQIIPRFTEDSEIHNILSNKQNLAKFREMVVMHIKKNDLSTKILGAEFDKVSNDVILPLNAFKQCLRVVGITLKPEVSNCLVSYLVIATPAVRSQRRHRVEGNNRHDRTKINGGRSISEREQKQQDLEDCHQTEGAGGDHGQRRDRSGV